MAAASPFVEYKTTKKAVIKGRSNSPRRIDRIFQISEESPLLRGKQPQRVEHNQSRPKPKPKMTNGAEKVHARVARGRLEQQSDEQLEITALALVELRYPFPKGASPIVGKLIVAPIEEQKILEPIDSQTPLKKFSLSGGLKEQLILQ